VSEQDVITLRDVGERYPQPPQGYYRVKLFGQAGSLIYEAIVQPYTSFQYVCPTYVSGLKVYGFEMIWEPTL
jgi:hypothetical protein